jgi:hypothetical protein
MPTPATDALLMVFSALEDAEQQEVVERIGHHPHHQRRQRGKRERPLHSFAAAGEEEWADWKMGNPLTFHDPVSSTYGSARFGHNEGFHGQLVTRFGLLEGKALVSRHPRSRTRLLPGLLHHALAGNGTAASRPKLQLRPRETRAVPASSDDLIAGLEDALPFSRLMPERATRTSSQFSLSPEQLCSGVYESLEDD